MRKRVLFILTVTLCSCSASYHLKKAIKKDPSMIDTLYHKIDTAFVLKKDTVYLDSVAENFVYRIDTLLKDTCVISEKKKTIIRYILKKEVLPASIESLRRDTISILTKNGKVMLWLSKDSLKASIEYKQVFIKDTEVKVKEPWYHFFKELWWVWLLLVVIFCIYIIKR